MRPLQRQRVQPYTSAMFLILLISGIVFIPQACALKCNGCSTSSDTCKGLERKCSAEFTHCATARETTYEGNRLMSDSMSGSCFKADDCESGSFDTGVLKYFFTVKCCNTDLCNTDKPPLPNIKPNPNGWKCHRCDGKSDCTGTLNCDGEETFCATFSERNKTYKGCATRSICVSPPGVLDSDVNRLKCCEGNYCNVGSSTSACLLLLAAMLTALCFFST